MLLSPEMKLWVFSHDFFLLLGGGEGGMRGRRGPCYALYSLKQICFTCTVSGYQSVPMLNCNRMWSEIHFGSVFLSLQYFPLLTSNCSAQNLFNFKQQGLFGCHFAEPFHPYNLPYSTWYIWTPFSLPLVWFLVAYSMNFYSNTFVIAQYASILTAVKDIVCASPPFPSSPHPL